MTARVERRTIGGAVETNGVVAEDEGRLNAVNAKIAGYIDKLCGRPAPGSEVMRPIATPIVGGMFTSTIHVLLVTPVIFFLMKERARKNGKLRASGMRVGQ